MVNLLTDELRAIEEKRYYNHRRFLLGLMILSLLVIAVVLLIWQYILIDLKEGIYRQAVTSSQNSPQGKEYASELQRVKTLNSLSKELSTDSGQSVRVIFDKINPKLIGLTLNSWNIKRESGQLKVQLEGVASSRKALLDFISFLRSSNFQSIDSPIADLLKDANSNFTINFVAATASTTKP